MGETLDATPARHLEMLLARAQNPFDVSDSVLERLDDAVLCQVEVHGWRHRNAPLPTLRCSSYRHAFLLADGSSLTLWELRHTTGGEDEQRFEIYECEDALRVSQRRVHEDPFGRDPYEPCTHPNADGSSVRADGHGRPADGAGGTEDPGRGFVDVLNGGGTARTRAWTRGNSPDHARRLLRRAENPDRPGEETLALLSTACGHAIVHMPRPHVCAHEPHVWCSVYEHAFLLADGSEFSLYELEHNLSRSGRLVCEIYFDESVADQAAHRHARDRGLDL